MDVVRKHDILRNAVVLPQTFEAEHIFSGHGENLGPLVHLLPRIVSELLFCQQIPHSAKGLQADADVACAYALQ